MGWVHVAAGTAMLRTGHAAVCDWGSVRLCCLRPSRVAGVADRLTAASASALAAGLALALLGCFAGGLGRVG